MQKMTAEKELLKQLDYTSSEEDYIEYEDTKENEVNLNRRKSKIGKFSSKEITKKRRKSKRNSGRDAKKNDQRKEATSKRANVDMSKIKVLKDSKKGAACNTGFITTRRLTNGITGIFGNSKSSDLVKRRGTRPSIDLSKRKMSVEVKEQVNRNLERILKHSSYDIQKSNDENNEVAWQSDEDRRQNAMDMEEANYNQAIDNRKSTIERKGQRSSSGSSSSTSGGIQEFITPKPQLPAEVPLEEISRRLKDAMKISQWFPGKSYLEELRDDIRKTCKQKVSILHNDEKTPPNDLTPQASKPNITLTTISRQRLQEVRSSRLSGKTDRELAEFTMTNHPEFEVEKQNVNTTKLEQHPRCRTYDNSQSTVDVCMDTTEDRHSIGSKSGIQEASKGNSNPVILEVEGITTRVPVLDDQILGPAQAKARQRFDQLPRCLFNCEGEKAMEERVETVPNNLLSNHCQPHVYHQHQQQQNQYDSGTYSSESTARDYHTTSSVQGRAIYEEHSPCLHSLCSRFYPRRQGRKETKISSTYPLNEGNQCIDHDYATLSSNFDILHYAGVVGDDPAVGMLNGIDDATHISNSFPYVPMLKKPCLDTPSPPIQFYRRKMF